MTNTPPRALFSPILAFVLTSAPAPAAAWSANGHRTVGQIAQTLLQNAAQQGDAASKAALDAIASLLGQNFSLADLAPCADEVRAMDELTGSPKTAGGTVSCGGLTLTVDPKSEPWHFVNVDITQPNTPDSVLAKCANDDCVVSQIKDDVRTLLDPGAGTTAKQVALMYLVHFVGDEHQPLHCATEIVGGVDDRGGNGKSVRYGGADLKFHALWDHLIQPTDNVNDPTALSQRLLGSLPSGAASQWTQGDFVMGAAVESLGIAEQTVYPSYYDAANGGSAQGRSRRGGGAQGQTRGHVVALPADYGDRMQPIAEQRLQMAGVRLAALLKQALGGAAAPAPAALKKKAVPAR